MNHAVFDIGVHHMLFVSIFVLAAGVTTLLTKRNGIGILIGIELIINAAALNFVAFWHFLYPDSMDGFAFTMFIIVLAAAEAAVALAIFLNFYNNFSTIDVEEADELKGRQTTSWTSNLLITSW